MDGRKDEAISTYLRMDNMPVTAPMRRGADFDKYVEDYVEKNGKLPDEFNGVELNKPKPKHTVTVDLPGFDKDMPISLKVELDIWDDPMIIEIKNSTARDSAEFSSDIQLSIYFYAMFLAGTEPKGADLYRYDPSRREFDVSRVWFSQRRFDDAHLIIQKHAPEIYKYFQEEGII